MMGPSTSTRRSHDRAPLLGTLLAGLMAASAASAATVNISVSDPSGEGLEYAVVSIHGATSRAAPEGSRAIVDQQARQFSPTVLPIQMGTSVSFPNTDDVRHHVYSFSAPNQFELKLYHGEPSQPIEFDHPGIVVLGCNIHDGMIGYLMVVDTPWYARTDAQGVTRIDDVPAGNYTLQVWHPDMQMRVKRQLLRVEQTGADVAISLDTEAAPTLESSPLQALFDD